MPSPTSGPLRLVRATVVALVVVALAGLAHVLGGGELPPAVVVAALTALVLACTAVLTARRIGSEVAMVALGAGQLVLHRAFEAFATTTCAGVPVASGGHAHHADHAAALVASCAPSAAHGSGGVMLGGSAMLVTHVVATVAAALVIAGADRALAWLVVWLRPVAGAPSTPVVPALGALPVAVADVSLAPQTWRGVVPRRGPPAWHTPVAP
ncbi:hypothetical protein [Cellulomonas sp.]|uniref:hypothetical protein n=1 Tax=Cellulomonas sp. TaxID=40001 RepID=UPI001B0E8832|nr:hypothetical protein [Cellulomonas sp.]MBO9554539.1 hypothetical protein [Cellulomonas sp.]